MRDLTEKIRGLQMVQAYEIIGLISALYVQISLFGSRPQFVPTIFLAAKRILVHFQLFCECACFN